MKLGAFSISLAVKDIPASKDFYEKLGFEAISGDMEQGWLIMRQGTTTLGLFCGMFPTNMMTFNPGWDANAQPVSAFDDIRNLQEAFKKSGIKIAQEIDPETSGPANFLIEDPDGNPIFFDQHL